MKPADQAQRERFTGELERNCLDVDERCSTSSR